MERVKRRRVRKRRRAQIEMVDWVLVRIGLLEFVLLMILVTGEDLPKEEDLSRMAAAAAAGEEEVGVEELESGKKTRSKPMPQLSWD